MDSWTLRLLPILLALPVALLTIWKMFFPSRSLLQNRHTSMMHSSDGMARSSVFLQPSHFAQSFTLSTVGDQLFPVVAAANISEVHCTITSFQYHALSFPLIKRKLSFFSFQQYCIRTLKFFSLDLHVQNVLNNNQRYPYALISSGSNSHVSAESATKLIGFHQMFFSHA